MAVKDNWIRHIPEQFRSKKNIEVLIQAFSSELEEAETMLLELQLCRSIERAVGKQLDRIGDIVVLSRAEANLLMGRDAGAIIDDERYRWLLKYKALRNSNRCTFPELEMACQMLYGSEMIYYKEEPEHPAHFYLYLCLEYTEAVLSMLQNQQLGIKPEGVSTSISYFEKWPFGFADTNDKAVGFGMGKFAQSAT